MNIIIITAIWIHGLLGEVAASHVEMDFNRGREVFVLRCIICHQCPVSLPLKMLPTKNDSVTYHVLLRYIHVSMLGIIFKIFMTPPPPKYKISWSPPKKIQVSIFNSMNGRPNLFSSINRGEKNDGHFNPKILEGFTKLKQLYILGRRNRTKFDMTRYLYHCLYARFCIMQHYFECDIWWHQSL